MNKEFMLDFSEKELGEIIDSRLPIAIWGFGGMISFICNNFEEYGIKINCIIDNDPKRWGTQYREIPLVSFDTLKNTYTDCHILIGVVTKKYVKEIKEQILRDGQYDKIHFIEMFYPFGIYSQRLIVDHLSDIMKVSNLLEDDKSKSVYIHKIQYILKKDPQLLQYDYESESEQYFDKSLINLNEIDGIFIDGGAYHGENTEQLFLKYPKTKLNAICIDPDDENIQYINRKYNNNKRIQVLKAAITEKNEYVTFNNSGARGGNISEINTQIATSNISTIPGIGIDDEFYNKDVKFIKLDIEGEELNCLKGAIKTIQRCHPIIAVCIYHSITDHFQIPLFIKQIEPLYKLYVRHYHYMGIETVLYAII